MLKTLFKIFGCIALAALLGNHATAAPVNYTLEPGHTYPSFEADHMGISLWRGKLNKSAGKVVIDKDAGTGSIEVTMLLNSIDFGHDQLNQWARGKDFFQVKKFPKAIYKGKLENFVNGAPTSATGELTLHGITKPVELKITHFKCIPHPLFKREYCGADVYGTINREEFGLSAGKDYGFNMGVQLRIQVEAIADKQ